MQNSASYHNWATIYEYYEKGGLTMYLVKGFSSIIIGLVISFLPVLIFGMCDFSVLKYSAKISEVVRPFSVGWRETNIFLKICVSVFALFNGFQFIQLIVSIPKFVSLHKYFTEALGISDLDLAVIEWSDVVDSIVVGDARRSTPLRAISQEILKTDNYICAFVSDPSLLNWHLPWAKEATPFPMSRFFFYLLKLAISGVLLDKTGGSLVNGANSVRAMHVAASLEFRFRLIGAVLALLSPFVFVFELLYLCFHYAQSIRSAPEALSMRRWTPRAKWIIREYNELPHVFKTRIAKSYEHANEFLDLFPTNRVIQPIAHAVSFLSGAAIAVILIVGLITDLNMVFSVRVFGDKTIVWLMAILASVYAATTALTTREVAFTPEEILAKVERDIHIDFREQNGSAHSWKSYNKLSSFFQPIWQQLLLELFSSVLNPFIFGIGLAHKAKSLVEFVKRNSINVDDLGWICVFSVFDADPDRVLIPSDQRDKMRRSMQHFSESPQKNEEPLINYLDVDSFTTTIDDSELQTTNQPPSTGGDASIRIDPANGMTPEDFLSGDSLNVSKD